MDTLLLDITTWDFVLDAAANIAVASVPYALAQDVASAIKTFLGEVWYDTTLGIKYIAGPDNSPGLVLGQVPPITVFKALMVKAALTVPGVVSAVCVVESFDLTTRLVTGQVQFTDSTGAVGATSF